MSRPRDYAFEALAEVTSTDPEVGRSALNAALKSIREQMPELDSYPLADEIHERAKMYRALFENAALTPTALAKHWKRVKEEGKKVRGSNLHAGHSGRMPPSRREQNKLEAQKLIETLWGKK
jgi:hypothetical protein